MSKENNTKMTDKELYKLCQKYGQNAREWSRKFAALLPEVYERKLYKKYRFTSIKEFAKKVGGLSESVVEEVLRTYKKVEDKPLLKAEIAKVGWGKVRAVTPIATKENEEEMVKLIKTLPKNGLEMYVKNVREKEESSSKQSNPSSNITQGINQIDSNKNPPGWVSQSVNVHFKIDKQTEFKLRKFKQKIEKERKEVVTFGEVLKELLKILENAQKVKGAKSSIQPNLNKGLKSSPLSTLINSNQKKSLVQSTSRYISQSIKEEKCNNGQCAFPDCNKPATVWHHQDRFALSRNHNNVVPLCEEHHQIAHAGLIHNEDQPPSCWSLKKSSDRYLLTSMIDRKYQEFKLVHPT